MNNPKELRYSETHEWVKIQNGEATIGITDFAQHSLGDITYVELPSEGTVLEKDSDMGAVESVKAASDLYSPVEGTIVAANEALNDQPEFINSSPYTEGWIIRVKLSAEPKGLMSAEEYETFCNK